MVMFLGLDKAVSIFGCCSISDPLNCLVTHMLPYKRNADSEVFCRG